MARLEGLIPHLLRWENSIIVRPGESLRDAFGRARAKGVVKVKGDSGGATLCGITLRTFEEWRREHAGTNGLREASEEELARLGYEEWLAILRTMFWDGCKGDRIENQSVANMLVDWRWVNGKQGVRDAQWVLSLVADGIVGPKTLAALNASPASGVFARLKGARERSYRRIVERRPSQEKFLKGWLNRVDSIKFD